MSGTNLYASTINSNVFVNMTNEAGLVDACELRGTTSLPTDTGLFSKGCFMKVEDDGSSYINDAEDGDTPSWVPQGASDSGITELTDDVTAGPGAGSVSATVAALQGHSLSVPEDLDAGASIVALSGGGLYTTNGAVSGSGNSYNESAFIIGAVKHVTTGGSASEDVTITNVDANSGIFVTLNDNGSNNVTVVSADYSGADTVTVLFSADPGNDAVISVMATRLVSYLD